MFKKLLLALLLVSSVGAVSACECGGIIQDGGVDRPIEPIKLDK